MNILNGGMHADNGLEIQEFMVVPYGAPSFPEALRAGVEIFHALKANLKKDGLVTAVGDEGGFAPRLENNEQALERIVAAIKDAGYEPGREVGLALDAALSEFYDEKTERYTFDKQEKTREQIVSIYEGYARKYPLISIEDGCAENDTAGWKLLTQKLGKSLQLVGDDLFVTSPARLAQGMKDGIANSILIKLNQIGTVTETLDWRPRAVIGPSFRTARARPRTRSSPSSPSPPTRGRSRPDRRPAPIGSRSTMSSSGSPMPSVRARSSRGAPGLPGRRRRRRRTARWCFSVQAR
jgi:enolase